MASKPRGSGKGLPPKVASYITESDHRGHIQRADARLAKKHKTRKERQHNKKVIEDPEIPPEIDKDEFEPVKYYQRNYI